MSVLNPKTTNYEFSGVPGVLAITFGLPILLVFFCYTINDTYLASGWTVNLAAIYSQLPRNASDVFAIVLDKKTWAAYLAWFFGLLVLDRILPGPMIEGIQLRDNTKLAYKINCGYIYLVVIGILAARLFALPKWFLPELEFLYTHQLQIVCVLTIFSFLLAIFVHIGSFIPLRNPNGLGTNERILAVGGNTGNTIYDWFIGRELNPRVGDWDIKLFCELRPGMLLWPLINASCLHAQYHAHGFVTNSMILVNLLQAYYIYGGVENEVRLLDMMDIKTDGFGFMLSFGDLVLVPWAYTLQCRYLALSMHEIDLFRAGLIFALHWGGYWIFHYTNKQKADFRSGKLEHKKYKYITTNTGSKLLCDGWWGKSQHINYLGDWIIGLSWCLPTGTDSILTYFYAIYFAALLVHRQQRDEVACREKYGRHWDEYTKQVPYKIVPYIY